jgi:hypothetical protein
VPTAPPAAGPDRALDPPPPGPPVPPPGLPVPPPGPGRLPAEGDAVDEEGDVAVDAGDVIVADGDVADAEGDEAQPAESPVTAHISAAAAIRPLLLFDSNRRTPGRRACSAMVAGADESGEDAGGGGGAAPAPSELPATGGRDVALETGRAGRVLSGLVGSYSFMMGLLLLRQLRRQCQPFMGGSCRRPVRGL